MSQHFDGGDQICVGDPEIQLDATTILLFLVLFIIVRYTILMLFRIIRAVVFPGIFLLLVFLYTNHFSKHESNVDLLLGVVENLFYAFTSILETVVKLFTTVFERS